MIDHGVGRITPDLQLRATLLFDGARLPLDTIADALRHPPRVVARMIGMGRLQAAAVDPVFRPGCADHVGGLVTGDMSALLHLQDCHACATAQGAMAEGITIARARWTNGATDSAPSPVVAVQTPETPHPTAVPAPPVAGAVAASAVPSPPAAVTRLVPRATGPAVQAA